MRYTITAHGTEGSKPRLRTALKLMGFESVRIEEKAEDVPKTERPAPDNLPSTPEAKAVADLFRRKHETPWADDEIRAFKAARKTGMLTVENMKLVTAFYEKERRLPENFCRTSLLTFCRHFGTELDKAKLAKPRNGKALEWAPSNNVIPMPAPTDEERAEVAAKLREFKATLRGGNGA